MSAKPKIVAVVGPTASGKTALSIKIAKLFNGEVISADSRQVYRGLDLGTGKVTEEEKQGVPHHLLDVADPMHVYTAAEFELDASNAILNIHSCNHLPIIAGGTFFYLDILRGIHQAAPVEPDETFRLSLMSHSTCELFHRLHTADPNRAETIDPKNRPRLVRALEIINALGSVPIHKRAPSPYDWLILGIKTHKVRLHQKIHDRLISRLEAGMLEEAEHLHSNGLSYERMHDLGLEYRYMAMHLQQQIKFEEMVEKLDLKTRQYAKRQKTWLKRDKEVEWFEPEDFEAIRQRVEVFLKE